LETRSFFRCNNIQRVDLGGSKHNLPDNGIKIKGRVFAESNLEYFGVDENAYIQEMDPIAFYDNKLLKTKHQIGITDYNLG
jgi:hypothetical protein